VLLGPAFMMAGFILLYPLLGKGAGIHNADGILSMIGSLALAAFAVFIYQFLFLWGEEIGWRGYALPKLQEKYHPLVASVILGVLWGFWHLPSFFTAGSIHEGMSLPFFVLATVGYSILYTWVYNGTGGSLLLTCLLHAANNTTVSFTMVFFKPIVGEPVFSLAVLALFDLLVIAVAGPRLAYRKPDGES
jgi:membrane protease YdiL (CAAX protease family)